MNRGSDLGRYGDNPAYYASMRPRFMNRGSEATRQRARSPGTRFNEAPIHESGKSRNIEELEDGTKASMRPRFMNRGSDRALPTDVQAALLQ